jgi:hypothetical protein
MRWSPGKGIDAAARAAAVGAVAEAEGVWRRGKTPAIRGMVKAGIGEESLSRPCFVYSEPELQSICMGQTVVRPFSARVGAESEHICPRAIRNSSSPLADSGSPCLHREGRFCERAFGLIEVKLGVTLFQARHLVAAPAEDASTRGPEPLKGGRRRSPAGPGTGVAVHPALLRDRSLPLFAVTGGAPRAEQHPAPGSWWMKQAATTCRGLRAQRC